MTCEHCSAASLSPIYGGYAMSCATCCARLVASARPMRQMQEAMLYAITRRAGRPGKAEVLQALKALDARSASRSGASSPAFGTSP